MHKKPWLICLELVIIYTVLARAELRWRQENPTQRFTNREGSAGFTGNLTDIGGSAKFADVDGFETKQSPDGDWFIENTTSGDKIDITYDDKGLLTPESKQTLNEAGFDVSSNIDTPTLSGVTEEFKLGNNTFTFPEEYGIEELSPGNWNIVDQNGEVVHALGLNFDGSLTSESIAELQAGGIGVNDSVSLVETRTPVSGLGVRILSTTTSVRQLKYIGHFGMVTIHLLRSLIKMNFVPMRAA